MMHKERPAFASFFFSAFYFLLKTMDFQILGRL
jgi:hypothetical protein